MLKIVKNTKTQLRYLKKLLPSPTNIKQNAISAVDFTKNGFASILLFIRDARNAYHVLYENNMKLALWHQENGNNLDAKLRYKIAYTFRKDHPEPLLGLAEIAITHKKHKKAVQYFTKALPLISCPEHRQQIERIIYEISI